MNIPDGENLMMEPLKGRDMAQEIEPQETVNGVLGRQAVAGHGQVFHVLTERFDDRNRHHWQVFQAAGGNDGEMMLCADRVTADGQGNLRRNDRRGGSCVDNQSNYLGVFGPFQQGMHDEEVEGLPRRIRRRRHLLEGNRVTRRWMVIRKGHEGHPFSPEHRLIDFFPIRAVDQEPATLGCGCRSIHTVYRNEQPFPPKPLADSINWLAFHKSIFHFLARSASGRPSPASASALMRRISSIKTGSWAASQSSNSSLVSAVSKTETGIVKTSFSAGSPT